MLIFIDIETTGLEESDKIVSIGLIAIESDKTLVLYDLANEGKKISPQASSVNHITDEMIKNKLPLNETDVYKFLQENNKDINILVAHNVKFDLEKLRASGLSWRGEVIDTCRVTKHLIPECEYFSLQFLRYELKLYRKEDSLLSEIKSDIQQKAHHALLDAVVTKLLYEYILLDISTQENMIELSSRNVLLQKLNFGKYNGNYIEDILMNDAGYLHWILSNVLDLDDDLRYSINYYLQGKL